MIKKIILFLFLFFGIFNLVKADSIPVENIFSDINSDYIYLEELQFLYDKGMITPDSSQKFNPQSLLNRDDFVGILMESTCKDCLQPNTDFSLINKYSSSEIFFDINKNNKNFYCIADAKEKGFVKGYDVSNVCENGDFLNGERPFCPANTIILEEALAVVLRASGLITQSEIDDINSKINAGVITEKLADDVSPKNSDGSLYSFYPYFYKALNYEIVDFDSDGNKKSYNLVNVSSDNKLRPKQAITKQDFLSIAFVAFKANACSEKVDYNIGLEMSIYDKSCNQGNIESCNLANLGGTETIYDFYPEVAIPEGDSIDEETGYIRRFYNFDTGEQEIIYGKYIDNYDFLEDGRYRVYLRVITENGNSGEVYNDINIKNNQEDEIQEDVSIGYDLKVSIDANPIYGNSPLLVDFESIVESDADIISYKWDFGDGEGVFGENTNHIYKEPGVYEVTLTVTDSDNNVSSSTVLIYVDDVVDLLSDIDLDGIIDIEDSCPLIYGLEKNNGCPVFDKFCSQDSECDNGYYCDTAPGICKPKVFSQSCEYSGGDLVYGNVSCNSCPCNNSLDFNAYLRKCDIVFPAITSPDFSKIYGKGDNFQIK